MDNPTQQNRILSASRKIIGYFSPIQWIIIIAAILAIDSTIYYLIHGYIVAYGDAESHLNIAKRVVDSLTPGFAQLGGIWLPLPHILLIPFVYFDVLWKTGLAGSIVSGIAFIITAVYLYRLTYLITKHSGASFFAALVFMLNPNILYMQSTPMTELTLLVFFTMSSYYFISFLQDDRKILNLLFAAFFGFCASLSRYDGWSLVLMEAGVLFLFYFPFRLSIRNFFLKIFKPRETGAIIQRNKTHAGASTYTRLEGRLIIFCTLALLGIIIWFAWGGLILGDPLYFTHSQFSAKSQQSSWLSRGELPAYGHIVTSFLYYFVTSMSTVGVVVFLLSIAGLLYFIGDREKKHKFFILLILAVPFIFNVVTLYLGQSVIFIPGLTPPTFEWTLFNVRYGVMMVPFIAFCIGFMFSKTRTSIKLILIGLVAFQLLLYGIGYTKVITLEDGRSGLSSFIAKIPDAQGWLEKNYDGGILLTDDYARTISIVRLPIKMHDVIYIGNKPYWEDSLTNPEKYARWIVMQRDDTIWQNLINDPIKQGRLYKYFNKAYTSEDILIFKRIENN